MKVAVFLNGLGLGGTEKAACLWAVALKRSGKNIRVIAIEDGARRKSLEEAGIPVAIVPEDSQNWAKLVANELREATVIHAHAPGFPQKGDILGEALRRLNRKIPVVQTNIFGQLRNPAEDTWTDFRLFISWTSCVQASQRSKRQLDAAFFRRQSVAVYPVDDPFESIRKELLQNEAANLREKLGLTHTNVLFGRFSRPEPNKWMPIVLRAFFSAQQQNPQIRLLLREPPPMIADELLASRKGVWSEEGMPSAATPIILMRTTADQGSLNIAQMACDAILHTSSIGESFGYGIAEPMALGRPVITHSVPWHDQAQLELVEHGECGLVANCLRTMVGAILQLAGDREMRVRYGERGREQILRLADPAASVAKLEVAMRCAVDRRDNPNASEDLLASRKAASDLELHQWGSAWDEYVHLRSNDMKIRFLRWQRALRNRLVKRQSVVV